MSAVAKLIPLAEPDHTVRQGVGGPTPPTPMVLSFFVPGDARSKGRPRATHRGGHVRLYTDDKTANYENLVRLCARQAIGGHPPMDGPLTCSIAVRIVVPASAPMKTKRAMLAGEKMPIRKPDLDNIVKAILDGCNGVAFVDDALIVQLVARKVYADTAGVSVCIAPAVQ